MTQAIVTGAFMTPEGAMLIGEDDERTPAPRVLQPSAPGLPPIRVEIDAATFERHYRLGNVESVRAWEILQESERAMESARRDARAAADLAREEAVHDVVRSGIREDLERLSDMDRQAMIDLALSRKLRVNTRRSEDNLRTDIAAALQEALERAD